MDINKFIIPGEKGGAINSKILMALATVAPWLFLKGRGSVVGAAEISLR